MKLMIAMFLLLSDATYAVNTGQLENEVQKKENYNSGGGHVNHFMVNVQSPIKMSLGLPGDFCRNGIGTCSNNDDVFFLKKNHLPNTFADFLAVKFKTLKDYYEYLPTGNTPFSIGGFSIAPDFYQDSNVQESKIKISGSLVAFPAGYVYLSWSPFFPPSREPIDPEDYCKGKTIECRRNQRLNTTVFLTDIHGEVAINPWDLPNSLKIETKSHDSNISTEFEYKKTYEGESSSRKLDTTHIRTYYYQIDSGDRRYEFECPIDLPYVVKLKNERMTKYSGKFSTTEYTLKSLVINGNTVNFGEKYVTNQTIYISTEVTSGTTSNTCEEGSIYCFKDEDSLKSDWPSWVKGSSDLQCK